jgi:small subunit ribosomal protein S4
VDQNYVLLVVWEYCLVLQKKKSKKKNITGQQAQNNDENGKKATEYRIRLEEKQKLKFNYGLNESQLYHYVKKARRKKGVTGLILLQLLEMRLDTICFTLGFAPSIASARQIVNHGHITVNEKVVSIPSFQCCINDVISVNQQISSKDLIKNNLKTNQFLNYPNHIKFDLKNLQGTINNYCDRNELLLELDELLVIEYYSRR